MALRRRLPMPQTQPLPRVPRIRVHEWRWLAVLGGLQLTFLPVLQADPARLIDRESQWDLFQVTP